jgi:hypothetical protein
MEINIQNDTMYLNDVEIWSYIIPRVANGGVYAPAAARPVILAEAGNLIDSIEIFADS